MLPGHGTPGVDVAQAIDASSMHQFVTELTQRRTFDDIDAHRGAR